MQNNPRKTFHLVFMFYVLLFLFTTFVLLYEFVIPHGGFIVENPVVTTTTTSNSGVTTSDNETTTITEELIYPGTVPSVLEDGIVLGSYFSDSVLITIYQIRATNSDVYVADVVVKDACTILTAFAYNTFGGTNITQTVSAMAIEHNAIFAINSDYASHYDSGFVIRNGLILRSSFSNRDAISLNIDGNLSTFTETTTTTQEVLDSGSWQLWSFGPVLIKDGVSVASVNDGLDRDAVNNPRTAFGQVGSNHFMFVCVDGRTTISHGADIEELAAIMVSLGCVEAYNFDGGGSSTMWFDGTLINHPSEGTERKVGDCVYIRR